MSKTLNDLYYGNLDTLESGAEKIPEYRKAERKKKRVREELEEQLGAKEKKLFHKYSDLRTQEECYMGQADFLHGFRMGIKLMAEIFCENQEK